MLSLTGLALNTLGAFIILIPDIPWMYRRAHSLPPLQTIEAGEKHLYFEGAIRPDHPGFNRITEAFFSGSPPLSDTPRLDELDSMSAYLRVGDKTFEVDGDGYAVRRIVRNEGDTISESTYTVELYSQAAQTIQQRLSEQGFTPSNPYLSIDSAQGALPELIETYKRRLFFRTGAALLLLGFVFQVIDRVLRPI
jgi:hypothetical protein